MAEVLVVGGDGRAFSLGKKIHEASKVSKVFFAPGNGGTHQFGENLDIRADDIDSLRRFAFDRKIDLTVVSPEGPLSKGIVNAFDEDYLPIFGPTREAAEIETSKSWQEEFMTRHNIPHPPVKRFVQKDRALAYEFAQRLQEIWPRGAVVKDPGLAAGKGVIVPDNPKNPEELIAGIDRVLNGEFGQTKEVLIQKRIYGREVSLMALTDGVIVIPLLPAQDHKRAYDNDCGPNTGGMGAFAPTATMPRELVMAAYRKILNPTVKGLREEGREFVGALYAGLMITDDEELRIEDRLQVIEFNCRFGDPEVQPVMQLFNRDLYRSLKNCADRNLCKEDVGFRNGSAVCVVLTSEGYPGNYETGKKITGLEHITHPDVDIIHAGTEMKNGEYYTTGGRVLGITAYGRDQQEARHRAYQQIQAIQFDGKTFRSDIAKI